MRVIYFHKPNVKSINESLNDHSQLKWVDYCRSEDLTIDVLADKVHLNHQKDFQNRVHPPYYEQTEAYEMIIFRTMDERYDVFQSRTRSTAIFIRENTLITVHDDNDSTLSSLFDKCHQ